MCNQFVTFFQKINRNIHKFSLLVISVLWQVPSRKKTKIPALVFVPFKLHVLFYISRYINFCFLTSSLFLQLKTACARLFIPQIKSLCHQPSLNPTTFGTRGELANKGSNDCFCKNGFYHSKILQMLGKSF